MFCEKCGKEIKDGDKFCPYCGAENKINKEAQVMIYRRILALKVQEKRKKERLSRSLF